MPRACPWIPFAAISAYNNITPPAPENPIITASTLAEAYLQMYDPRKDSEALKTHPELFEQLRGDYPLRREKTAFSVHLITKE